MERQRSTRREARLFVVNGLSDDLTVVDVATAKALKTIPVGRVPYGGGGRLKAGAGLATLVLSAALLPASAASLRATLIVPADDARLERTRIERAYLGHPGGPARDGVQVALDESRFELEAASTGVALEPVVAASREAAPPPRSRPRRPALRCC